MSGNGSAIAQAARGGNGQMQRVDPAAALVERMMPQITRALPRHLDGGRFERLLLTQLRTVPKLMQCSPASLMAAMMTVGQLGLEPDKATGHVYLIPYGREVQVVIGYRGLIELARRSGQIKSIMARIAYAGDEFEIRLGTDEGITHRPALKGRGDPIAVYAVATLNDGTQVFDWMTVEEVEAVRERSRSGKSGPWTTDWGEMARKTVVRRLAKYLPLSPELADGLAADGAHTLADRQTGEVVMTYAGNDDDVLDVEPEPDSGDATKRNGTRNGHATTTGDRAPEDEPDPVEYARRVLGGNRLTIDQMRYLLERLTERDASRLKKEALLVAIPQAVKDCDIDIDTFRDWLADAETNA